MSDPTAKVDYNDLRRSDRDEVFLRTTLSMGKKISISAQLVNISAHGFMARTLEPFTSDSRIRIMLPVVGDVGARVIWALGGRIGCSFETPFDVKEFPKIVAGIKSAKPNWQFS